MHPSDTKTRRRALLALIATAALMAPASQAARLAVTPTRINLIGDGVASLTLRNRSTETVLVQARVFDWAQVEGSDSLAPTRTILVSPAIVELPPDSDRVVRIAHTGPNSPSHEKTYRLILSEVVPAVANAPGVAIRFAIEFNLPIFVLPANSRVEPRLEWNLEPDDRGRWQLQATNLGTSHAQIRTVTVTCGEGEGTVAIANLHRARYVLTGSRIAWPIALDAAPCPHGPDLDVGLPLVTYQTETMATDDPLAAVAGRVDEVIDVSSRAPVLPPGLIALRVHATTDFGPNESSLKVTRAARVQTVENAAQLRP